MLFANYDSKKVEAVMSNTQVDLERKAYFEKMGVTIENATSLVTALKLSGLDFEVRKLPLFHAGVQNEYAFKQVPEFFATVRTDTETTLGVVGKDYTLLQNIEAFNFLESLVGTGKAKFETAGFFRKNGAASYIQMSTEPISILGDDFDNYILISNGFDGISAVTVVITPIRAICRNTAMLALRKASNKVSVRHSVNLHDNLENAKEVLFASSNYLTALKEEAEKLATKPFSKEAFEALCYRLYPVKDDMAEITQIRNLFQIEQLLKAYQQGDLENFNGSAWKAFQAVSDFESHKPVFRKSKKLANTGTPEFKTVVIDGMPLLNKAFKMIQEAV